MSENHRHPGTRSCSVWAWLRTAYGWSPCSAGRRRWPSAWSWAVRWENGLPGGLTSGWAGAPRLRVWILRGPVCGREPRRNFLRGSRFFLLCLVDRLHALIAPISRPAAPHYGSSVSHRPGKALPPSSGIYQYPTEMAVTCSGSTGSGYVQQS